MSSDSGGDWLAAAVVATGERWRQLRINFCCQNQRECHPCRKESKLPQDEELPSDHAKKALEVLCLPAVTPLQEIINQGPVILGQITARELTVHIDRLANIFRYVNHPEAVAEAIQKLWPIFKAIFDL